MTDPDRTEHTHGAPRTAHGARSVAIYALVYVAVVALSVPALSVFTDPQLAAAVWIVGAIVFYVLSWRRLIAKGATDYARGFLVLAMTIVVSATAYFAMVTVFRALGFSRSQ